MFEWICSRSRPLAVGAALVAVAIGLRLAGQPREALAGSQVAAPDLIVGDLGASVQNHGTLNGSSAFSCATTSCNVGTAALDWLPDPDPRHPVIAQNLFRVKGGRIEQLGMSWLKHGFSVAAGSVCGNCTDPSSIRLGVNCSDPYSASLNAIQSNLGPRSQVNASTGSFVLPFRTPVAPNLLAGRLQARNADLDPADAHFVEVIYIHPQDSAAKNSTNNASYRRAFIAKVGETRIMSFRGGAGETTQRTLPAMEAWKSLHADVRIVPVDVPGDGRMLVGIRSTPTAGGWHHEVAVQNLTSDRSARGVTFQTAGGAAPTNPTFRDVDYFDEPYSGDDWVATTNGPAIGWATSTFTANPNANALRWGTLYNFGFDSAQPVTGAVIGLFKPGAAGAADEIPVPLLPALTPAVLPMPAAAPWATAEGTKESSGEAATDRTIQVDRVVTVRCGPGHELASVTSGFAGVAPKIEKKAGGGATVWEVRLDPTGKAKGYYETILSLRSSVPGAAPITIRAFGELPERK